MKNIVVIGAGTMGNGIAHTFAQTGFKVNLVDVSKEFRQRISTISKNLDRIIAKETLPKNKKQKL
jgi:3-hydroxybutyryl-CoA dehydrogenase